MNSVQKVFCWLFCLLISSIVAFSQDFGFESGSFNILDSASEKNEKPDVIQNELQQNFSEQKVGNSEKEKVVKLIKDNKDKKITDEELVNKLLELAKEEENSIAMVILASTAESGGISVDKEQIKAWYQRAAELGEPTAIEWVRKQKGKTQELKKQKLNEKRLCLSINELTCQRWEHERILLKRLPSKQYFDELNALALKRTNTVAMIELANLFANGLADRGQVIIKKDTDANKFWIKKAADCGNPDAIRALYSETVYPEAKDIILELGNGVQLELKWIGCENFEMGSPKEELGRNPVKERQTVVNLSSDMPGFYIGTYEITQEQYNAIMGTNPSHFKGNRKPVDSVRWRDAVDFCDEVTIKYRSQIPAGFECQLPTEAQWEFACRAGTKTAFNNGRDLNDKRITRGLDSIGWYKGNSKKETHEVGQKDPNGFGLYDMHGNVAEWCMNDFRKNNTVNSLRRDKVVRGGSWKDNAVGCRSACRDHISMKRSNKGLGFRVVLTPSIENH